MLALSAALVALQATATALPSGQLVLGKSSVRAGESVPALLVVSAPDTLAALAASATVVALPAGVLWWRGAEQGCGRPPADARPQLEWSGTVRGDEPLPLCVRAAGEGPLRLTATLRALQPDGTWRVRVIVSEPAAAGEPFISSSIFLALVTAVLGFAFGVAANLIQLRGQQRGEREKRSQELDLKRLAVDEKVFDSVTAEVQKNVDVLRAVIAGNPPPGVVQLTLAGMQAVLADPETAAFLNDGDGRPYQQRMRRVYNHMRDFNRAVRDPNNQVPLAQLAARARDGIEAELQV